ncbi:translation initiation factor IF-2 [bacterium BMS3Bbin14]|nr:translation initiation factor IF-2 [bacterium BMS3Bbin14]HDO30314.1 translation initiation factor IF-2 [Desulfobacteraceae bacterium]
MSKVRIYELAKEAGLKSKELADRLIELGYPVTSHSSTVDNDMAADIRRKVFGKASIEVTGKRIKVKRAPVAAQPTTVVRRRSKAVKEEIARIAEEARAEEEAEAVAAEEEEMVAAGTPPGDEVEVAAGPVEEPEQEGEAEAPPEEEEVVAAKDEAAAEPDSVGKKPVPVEAKAPRRLAKVVGKVEIRPPVERKKRVPKRPVRPARPSGPKPAIGAPPPGPHDGRGAVKGKKKGKRVVAIQADSDEGRARRTGKVARRGRQRVDFIHGDDVEFMRARKGRKRKGKDGGKKEKFAQAPAAETKAIKKRIKVFDTISVGDLAKRMGIKANEVIAKLMGLGVMATLNQSLDVDTATLVAADFGYEVEQGMTEELEVINLQEQELGGEEVARPPVVTVMGHVDHGKTSILDAIRKTDVAEGEAGGITQHIGAYHVLAPSGDVVFVDTPGHAAFTEMRSRGAKVTDIVVLVVAADDGVMDQTREAIAHARAAEVPIVVAINKIDKDNADTERVKRELSEFGLIPEDWGGDTIYCETSAKRHIGIEELLESIHLQAEILELKADVDRKARGTVIEAQLHKGRGPLATVLVQGGTLRIGDYFVAGRYSGKVRSLTNDRGVQVKEAGPSMPVEVQGLSGVPQAGDEFIVVTDEKMAKSVSESRRLKARESELASVSKVSLDNLFEKMAEQELKELRVVLRSDVQGTLEAFGQAVEKLSTDAIRVRILHEDTGSITENDVHLAAASEAVIIGFNVRPTVKVKELAEQENVDIRTYDVIYHALEDIEKAMVGMLEPTFVERVIGTAVVRETFHVPKVGTVAGCAVIDGKIERSARVRVMRDGVVVYTGKIDSLRRFKDDVKEVLTGYECGISVENFNDIKLDDHLEAFVMDEVEATL